MKWLTSVLFFVSQLCFASEMDNFYKKLAESQYETLLDQQKDPTLAIGVLDSEMHFYKASKLPALQTLVDKAIKKLFSSKSFLTSFCPIYGTLPETHVQLLGISTSISHETSQICRKFIGKEFNLSNIPKFPKNYLFTFNIPNQHPLQSWTSFRNDTFIFFEEKISEAELTTRILHELAVGNDPILGMSTKTFANLVHNYDYQLISETNNHDTEIDNLVSLHSIPLVRFSFAILRASIIEQQMTAEIYGKDIFKSLTNRKLFELIEQGRNREAVALIMRENLLHQRFFLSLENTILYSVLGDDLFKPFYLQDHQIDYILNSLENLKIKFYRPKESFLKLNAREWLSLAIVGYESTFYSRGPRPRIGGGWDQQSIEQNNRIDVLSSYKNSLQSSPQSNHNLKPPSLIRKEFNFKYEKQTN